MASNKKVSGTKDASKGGKTRYSETVTLYRTG